MSTHKYLDTTGLGQVWGKIKDYADPFIVTVTSNTSNGTTTYSFDKTFAEITTAYNAGKICIARDSSSTYYLSYINNSTIRFVYILISTSANIQLQSGIAFEINSSNVVTRANKNWYSTSSIKNICVGKEAIGKVNGTYSWATGSGTFSETAYQNYSEGDLFWRTNTELVKAITNISSGSTLTENTNYVITKVSDELQRIDGNTTPFVVTVSGSSSAGYTSDKTYAQIEAAYNAGKRCICIDSTGSTSLPLNVSQVHPTAPTGAFARFTTFLDISVSNTTGEKKASLRSIMIKADGTIEVKTMFAEGANDLLSKYNTTAYTPTTDYNPATKKYVDDSINNIPSDSNKVDTISPGVNNGTYRILQGYSDEESISITYRDSNNNNHGLTVSNVDTTLTGLAAPVNDTDAATKKYVDDKSLMIVTITSSGSGDNTIYSADKTFAEIYEHFVNNDGLLMAIDDNGSCIWLSASPYVEMESGEITYGEISFIASAADNNSSWQYGYTIYSDNSIEYVHAQTPRIAVYNATNDQVLMYDSNTFAWVNRSIPASNLSGLTDTTISSPANGQVLMYNSTTSKWENTSLPVYGGEVTEIWNGGSY